jgi:hypothetical protein
LLPLCTGRSLTTPHPKMPDTHHLKERLALNESIERDLNAVTAEWRNGAGEKETRLFWCECSQPLCGARLEVKKDEWDSVRADPHRFFVAPGHVDRRIGELVERRERFWVVEKTDSIARNVTERTDPIRNPLLADE